MCRLQIGRPTTVHGSSMSCFQAYIWSVYEHHSRTKPCVHGARWSCQSVEDGVRRERQCVAAAAAAASALLRGFVRGVAGLQPGCIWAATQLRPQPQPALLEYVGLGWSKRDSEAPVPFQRTSPFEQCQSELKVPLTITHNTSLECFALCSPLNPACFRS